MKGPTIVKLHSWGGWMPGACHDFLMSDGSIQTIEHFRSLELRAKTGENAPALCIDPNDSQTRHDET